MRNKKIYKILAFLFMSLLCFTGCKESTRIVIVDNNKVEENTTELTFYGFKADELDFTAIENILHGFMNKNNKIQVGYEGIKAAYYWEVLKKRNASNCLDDVFMIDQEHVIHMYDILADVRDSIDLNMFNDLVQSQILKEDGTIRFVPTTIASYCLYINYDLLKENNIKVPENYNEFKVACDYFKNKGITPIICNMRRSLCSLVQGKSLFDVYQQKNSGEIIEQFNNNPSLLADKLSLGLDFINDMFVRGWIDPAQTLATKQSSINESENGDLWQFSLGKQPFVVTGGWAPKRLKKILADNGKTMNFGVHPYPIMEDGSVLVMDINNCISVNKNGKHLEESKLFLSYLTNPDSIWEYCDDQCCFSPLKNETRIPSENTVAPTAPYYTNGRAVIGTNYQLDMPLDSYLMAVTTDMCKGVSVEQAKIRLKNLLMGVEAI